jgi:hypothetical protein
MSPNVEQVEHVDFLLSLFDCEISLLRFYWPDALDTVMTIIKKPSVLHPRSCRTQLPLLKSNCLERHL